MAAFRRPLTTLALSQAIHKPFIAPQAPCSMLARTCNPDTVEKVTHTGQKYSADDYRRVRFLGKEKLVNSHFAIDLIADDPVVVVNAKSIWSNGGGALGHPRVFINLNKPEIAICGYSGRKFIQKTFYNEAEHGPSITYEEYLADAGK
ncbi:NADH dehydrogenase [ubiquinone] iron-sulfur protein 6, mitochondrial [Octopus bimaculoides]|uniref:Zinc finger CHCC-type domain-containing protein n=1 Tax=Octopus bimaculoides TaxID=37653 RepID=A0A0L8FNJ5_OCTBM|nr:NADH dehydrogenase [ubiquinone] iron-sulfur protein 6, mitochondrial [Octopus bimaculoides]|eukprot:XP_014788306.1 PREDICTED: NADH dehydrogenase [ubiquinone] iron-sulfur protein 6, mitochondrial-like [Octopus bimaculoides]